jgi:uncharacterized phage protein (TIGR01671 family)
MREIKCRAWDKDAKKMFHEGFAIAQCSGGPTFFWMDFLCGDRALKNSSDIEVSLKKKYDIDNPVVLDFADWSFERMILMRFTGLRDKNGKEIYEGDILGGNTPSQLPFVVVPILGGLSIVNAYHLGKEHNELIASPTNDAQTASWIQAAEVIGNIYETRNY